MLLINWYALPSKIPMAPVRLFTICSRSSTRQVTTAEGAGKTDVVADLERNRAMLTPFLVKWASTHPNPEIRKLTYTYSVFDADTQRRAAELTADPDKKKQLLGASLKRFQELNSPEFIKQYVATLPTDKQAKAKYDSQVIMGLGRVYFAQEDWD